MAEMKKRKGFPKHLSAIWDETIGTVRSAIGAAGLEALCGQIYRAREAEKRIHSEGMVVEDAKGSPVPHPAIAVERSAQAEIRRWLEKYSDDDDY